MQNPFVNIPFFRIVIPFVIGVVFALSNYAFNVGTLTLLIAFSLVLCLGIFQIKYPKIKFHFLLASDCLLFLFAIALTKHNQLHINKNYFANKYNINTENYFIAEVNDIAIKKDNFYKVPVKLIAIKDDSVYKSINAYSFCYIKTNNLRLLNSQQFIFKASANEVQAPLNPFEFDYKTYLKNKNITHTFFIDSNCYRSLPSFSTNKIWTLGLNLKQTILNNLKQSNLNNNAYAICSALITGYDDEIDKTTISAFSKTGTLHVLSVSGLHTGLIFIVLNFLADLIDRIKKYKITRFIFLTALLWLFALITGFSSPVLRAVIMLNLIGLGQLFFRHTTKNQLNVLAFSAFVLLIYNPFYLCDIGFLLSYFALYGLIYFLEPIQQIFKFKNKIANYLWVNSATSIAATISTLPITLYYFHQFPIWFIVCNLIIVPATFLLLLLSFLLLIKVSVVATIINGLISLLLKFIHLFNNGSIELIAFNFLDMCFLSAVIIFITLSLQTRNYKIAFTTCTIIICWQITSIVNVHQQKQSVFFVTYHCKKTNTVAVKSGNKLIYNTIDSLEFDYRLKPHLTSLCYVDTALSNFNFININNENYLLLNKKNAKPYINPKFVNKLLIANNYNLKKEEIEEYKNLNEVIVDGSNSYYNCNKIEKLCRKFGITFYNTKVNGAYINYF